MPALYLNSGDCLGVLVVVAAAGARTNDYLTGGALRSGEPGIVVGPPAAYDELDAILGPPRGPAC